ncbi:ABC transporter substrate-binding protein [Actinopolyspora erythraea]|uniref:ABC transporter substrate-binding protein n=1 Tax=Actinopolyspora erythraea TaxID=414996 RepID=A0A099D584_9ACTN|nr:glutamate ABC transporter substrate-binding protein [Actinopolyspora erythraea]ASU79534.1 ABC transporter substrate-binding protein [Actinopolyspora erythraea]KGI81081.1 ABC transporter substrate-binding protein [Actinopolyspora erythraea]
MRNGKLTAAAIAASMGLLLSACGGGSADEEGFSAPVADNPSFEDGTTMAEYADSGEITIGVKKDQPLFGLENLNGEMEGFDVAIGEIIAGKLGIPADAINWKETPSKNRELYLEQGKVDMVVATYTINDKRAERVSFAGPYYEAGQDLMVKQSNDSITGPESLRDSEAKVCSARGSTPSERIREYIDNSRLVLFDTYSKCADALRNGQAQAVTTDNSILMGLVSENENQFKVVGETFSEEPYGVGIVKGDVDFCEFINDSLRTAAENGTYQEAWNSTAGEVSEKTPELPELRSCS